MFLSPLKFILQEFSGKETGVKAWNGELERAWRILPANTDYLSSTIEKSESMRYNLIDCVVFFKKSLPGKSMYRIVQLFALSVCISNGVNAIT